MRKLVLLALWAAASVSAQTATTQKSVDTAYGARFLQPEGVEVNSRRVNNRIHNRLSDRLSTRIQRYDVVKDPVASLRVNPATDAKRAQNALVPQE